MEKRRKPVENRETIEVDGKNLRLTEVAELHPEILARRIAEGHGRTDAYWTVLMKAGHTRENVYARCEEWGIDLGQIIQMW